MDYFIKFKKLYTSEEQEDQTSDIPNYSLLSFPNSRILEIVNIDRGNKRGIEENDSVQVHNVEESNTLNHISALPINNNGGMLVLDELENYVESLVIEDDAGMVQEQSPGLKLENNANLLLPEKEVTEIVISNVNDMFILG